MAAIKDIKHIVVIGDGNVGKTSLIYAFSKKPFREYYVPTIYDEEEFIMDLDGKTYWVKIHDTAGQEEYQRLSEIVHELADAFILCFSIPDRPSFDNITIKWTKILKEFHATVPIILVGTKEDMRTRSSVSTEEGEALRKKIKANKFIESSAKTMTNVKEVFSEALRATEVGIIKEKNKNCMCWCKNA